MKDAGDCEYRGRVLEGNGTRSVVAVADLFVAAVGPLVKALEYGRASGSIGSRFVDKCMQAKEITSQIACEGLAYDDKKYIPKQKSGP